MTTAREPKLPLHSLEEALEAVPEGFLVLDRSLTVKYCNAAGAQVLQRARVEFQGRPFFESFCEFKGSVLEENFHRCLDDGLSQSFDVYLGVSPHTGWYDVALSPYAEGVAVRITKTTERHELQEELRRAKEELERFFSNALDLFCIADTEGHFLRLNPQWEKVLGYAIADLEGRRFMDFVHPDDIPATENALAALAGASEIQGFVNRYKAADGAWRWIEWNSYPSGPRIFAAARDITERIRMEGALRAAVEEKEMLLKELSHRVKNSLAIIASLISLEADRLGDPSCAACRSGMERLQTRIQTIGLIYEKLTARGGASQIDAAEYLRDLIGLLSENLASPEGALRVEVSTDHVELDAKRAVALGLIANEAVTNAFKHGLKGGEGSLEVGLHEEAGRIRLVIQDSGPGFPAGFDPETQGSLGMDLLRMETSELRGACRLVNKPGARVEIEFPR